MKSPVYRVSDVADQIRGVTYSKQDASKTALPDYVPILRAGNITDDGLIFDDLVYVPCFKVSPKQKIQKDDIVIAASSGSLDVVGKAARVNTDFNGGFGAFCKVLRPRKEVNAAYFSHYFKTPEYRRKISSLAAGININNLRNGDLDNLQIHLPTLAEQKRIAGILDAVDALRAKRRESLAQLDVLFQSTFLTLFGDPIENPMGWKMTSMRSVVGDSFRNGLSPSTRGSVEGKVLTLSAITSGTFVGSFRKTASFDRTPSENQMVSADTFLICRGNGNKEMVGIGLYPTGRNSGVSFPDTMIAATPNDEMVTPAYLQAVWASRFVRDQITRGARTTNGTHKVNQGLLGNITFPLPPLDLQHRFAAIADSIGKQKARQGTHLAELDALFASLQHRAFNGELKVA